MARISNDPKKYRNRASNSSSGRAKEQPAANRSIFEFEVRNDFYLVRKKK